MKKYRKYIIRFFVWVLAFYLSLSSFILVKIITNDILLNSYNVYSQIKLWWNKVVDKVETTYSKWKVLFDKYLHKDKYKKTKQELEMKLEKTKQEQENLEKEMEFNKLILSGLPYVISFIIFIFSYAKVLKWTEELVDRFFA